MTTTQGISALSRMWSPGLEAGGSMVSSMLGLLVSGLTRIHRLKGDTARDVRLSTC